MNWFVKIFKNKPQATLAFIDEKSETKWKIYELFEKGQECYINKQFDEALVNFDSAVDLGFEEYFPYDAAKLFDFRSGCQEALDYHFDAIKDIDKSISLDANDSNKYFSRSNYKDWIMDYEGALSDLKKAIELSKVDNELNRFYNNEARKRGYSNVSELYQMSVLRVQMNLESEKKYRDEVENAPNPEKKAFWQKMIDEKKEIRLKQVKRKGE